MNNRKTKQVVLSALFAAMVFVCTRFTQIPIFGGQGYVHIGDAFVFLSAAMLPAPFAMAASAIGAGLADFTSGYTIYVLPTAIIKALMALAFLGNKNIKILSVRSIISCVIGCIVLVGGYYITEVILYQNFISPLLGMVWNAAQGIFSAVGFVVLAVALDKVKAKQRLRG